MKAPIATGHSLDTAAEVLGISQVELIRRMTLHGIKPAERRIKEITTSEMEKLKRYK